MSLGRVLGLLVSACVAGFAGLFGAFVFRDRLPIPAIERSAARRAIDSERAVVQRMGMTVAGEGDGRLTGRRGTWTLPLEVGARECVAVIVATYDHHLPERIWIDGGSVDVGSVSIFSLDANADVRAVGDASGLTLHVQHCGWSPERLRVAVRTRAHDTFSVTPTGGSLAYAVYRVPWDRIDGVAGLTRGRVTEAGMRRLGSEPARAQTLRAVPAGETLFGPTVTIRAGAARLIPMNEANQRLLRGAISAQAGETVNPSIDLSAVEGDTWQITAPPLDPTLSADAMLARMTPTHDAVIELRDNVFVRVLAVVDRAALGRRCVTLLFTRDRYGYAAEVSRFVLAGRSRSSLVRRGNVALDTVCPATGTEIYVVPDSDQENYRLQASSPDALPPSATGDATAAVVPNAKPPQGRHRRR